MYGRQIPIPRINVYANKGELLSLIWWKWSILSTCYQGTSRSLWARDHIKDSFFVFHDGIRAFSSACSQIGLGESVCCWNHIYLPSLPPWSLLFISHWTMTWVAKGRGWLSTWLLKSSFAETTFWWVSYGTQHFCIPCPYGEIYLHTSSPNIFWSHSINFLVTFFPIPDHPVRLFATALDSIYGCTFAHFSF